ncbi:MULTISPECIES: hypothetical protein [unclassified Variovorax]|uniref:hypothetical protein n=2 Tax=unclassified Variovorax TaxID=663243 RepID=UPI001E49D122|nr:MULTISPECIES: hypothetical protein [unclassified Variovorax]
MEEIAMQTWAKVLDWIGVACFGVGALAMARYPQASPWVMVIHLLPFGAALIAFRPDSSRVAVVGALALNGLWLAGLAAAVAFVLWSLKARESLFIAVFIAVMATPCLLNILALMSSKNRAVAGESAAHTSFAAAE